MMDAWEAGCKIKCRELENGPCVRVYRIKHRELGNGECLGVYRIKHREFRNGGCLGVLLRTLNVV